MSWGLYSPNLGLVITLKPSFNKPSLNLFPPHIVYCMWNVMNIKLYNYFGWQKKALIEARNEIWEKNKIIAQLKKTIAELSSDLVKKEEIEEDIINRFLKM